MKISAFISTIFVPVFFLAFVLTACTTTSPVPATPITTQVQATMVANAVSTINARWTAEAALNPSPTATLAPSSTPTQVAPTLTSLPPTLTPTVTVTPTSTPLPVTAEVLGIWTYPSSKTEYRGNERFGIAIYLKNTGSESWGPGYQLKLIAHVGAEEVTVQTAARLTSTVAPGGKVEFDLWAFGSESPGKHTYTFGLYTNYGILVYGSKASFTYTAVL